MSAKKLGLFDLISPQYVAGIQLPQQASNLLSILKVNELNAFYADEFIVYSGITGFEGEGEGSTEIEYQPQSGGNFSWARKDLHFRMIIPRDGAEFIDRAANDSTNGKLPDVAALLNDLRPQPDVDMDSSGVEVVDYPAVKFRLELFIDILNFSLGSDWKPGVMDPASNRIKIDPNNSNSSVLISLPKVLLSFEQGDDANDLNPDFNIEGWGMAGFDSPQDLEMGELIRMKPSIAVHTSEHIAFSLDKIIIDNSDTATPPDILEHFGVDEAWQGLYIGQALLYYSNDQGLGFNLRFNDALIGFEGNVSFEAALDIYTRDTLSTLRATPLFYNGEERAGNLHRGIIRPPVTAPPSGSPKGRITVKEGAVIHLEIQGGMPNYTIQVMENGSNIWNSSNRTATLTNTGDRNLFILVTDSSVPTPLRFSEYIKVSVQAEVAETPPQGTEADRPATSEPLQNLGAFNISGNNQNHELSIEGSENSDEVFLSVRGPEPFTLNITGGSLPLNFTNQRTVSLHVPNGTNLGVELQFPASGGGIMTTTPEVKFTFARPSPNDGDISGFTATPPTTNDSIFTSSWNAISAHFPPASNISFIQLEGWASNDGGRESATYDVNLSKRRVQVVHSRLIAIYPDATINSSFYGHGDVDGDGVLENELPYPSEVSPDNRMVRIQFTESASPQVIINANLIRPAFNPAEPVPATPPSTPPSAPPLPNDIPPVLKQLGIRVKVEMGRLSLLEIYGEIDFQTELEERIRDESGQTGPLEMSNDGLVEFKLSYQYDQATNETTLTFRLNSDATDTDGLLHMDNNANRDDKLKNIFGALLLFAPIINSSATAVGNNTEDAGAWVSLAVGLGVPVAIGGMDIFRTRKVILHGGEARTRFVTPAPGENLRSLDLGLIFDYEVQFDIICEQLGIGLERLPGATPPLPPPLKARYKAIGFNLNYSDTPEITGMTYTPVFDTSKGYDLDLSDPSLFKLPDPLGQLFNIVGARLARFNPVTLEVDFAIKVDLGIITVDRFKLKIPLYNESGENPGPPQIIPSGVRVNIPGVLVGNGFVEIVDTNVQVPVNVNNPDEGYTEIPAKGVQGGIDLTLVSLKIRITANVGIGTIKDPVTKREAISVFVGLRVEFPSPIVLGATGLGIFGFLGVFAMHYKRLEPETDPTSPVGPALRWLINADGDPTNLRNGTTPLWGMALDRWSFGIGVLMGTLEGGFLVNLQGMFVLELPGPRILIMVKAKIVSLLPSNPAKPATELQVGIIGIVDIDFGRQQLTLGVMLNFQIEQVLAVSLPIELYFSWNNPGNWHLWLGTIAQPASATILDIVRGSAYLMIQGNELDYSKFGSKVPMFLRDKKLNGIAIAIGLEAAIVLGDESAGIYLKIAAGCHFGVSFQPLLIVGNMYFEGKLKLLIISISARGSFDVLVSQIPNTTDLKVYIHGEVCGSIDLFFFELSACVGITIGDKNFDVIPPPLVKGVYLQSFSPVLASGQGTEKPIDASLGNAHDLDSGSSPDDLLTVPIDSIPVIQMFSAPTLDNQFEQNSFIESPGTYSGTGGCLKLSDEVTVKYTLKSLILKENGSNYNDPGGKPPGVWRIDRPKNNSPSDTSIDLATFSRVPATAPHAIERSTELDTLVKVRWENACKNPAPPAPVLYTFCNKKIGYSANGWTLNGIAKPDPEGTIRYETTPTTMRVYESNQDQKFNSFEVLLEEAGVGGCNAAKVLGFDQFNLNIPPSREKKCIRLLRDRKSFQINPLIVEEEIRIFSASEKKSFFNSKKGFISHSRLKPFESPYRTHYRSIKKVTGLSIREYMRIDILKEPANEVTIQFTCFNTRAKERPRILFYAYNSESQILDKKIFVDKNRKEEVHSIVLKGDEIKHIIVYNRNFTGQFVEVCLTRIKHPDYDALKEYFRCFRTLQLAYCNKLDEKRLVTFREMFNMDELERYLKQKSKCCYTIFETGACESILFYGAILDYRTEVSISRLAASTSNSPELAQFIIVEELDNLNNVMAQHSLDELIVDDNVIPLTDLPADWLDANLPWRNRIIPVATYLQSGFFDNHRKILFSIKPNSSATTRIRICTCIEEMGVPLLMISAIQTLQLSEVEQNSQISEMLETEKETLTGYLNNTSTVPLMNPGKVYELEITYDAQVEIKKNIDGELQEETRDFNDQVQRFQFETDTKPPLPLSPYVLGTLPAMDEQFHFFRDPLSVVFNDNSFLKVYNTYGKQLKAIIRGADGKPVFNSPEIINTLEEIPAEVKTPYREAIEALINAGELPCLGEIEFPHHASYTPPFELKPLMPYTFDIEFDPKDEIPPDRSEKPLFRRAFKTSRYGDLEEFVNAMASEAIKHKALASNFVDLPTPVTGTEPSVHTLSDVAFENMLISGGIMASASREITDFTLCWGNQSGDFIPQALLINSSEPIWRKRMIAAKKSVINAEEKEIDPAFKIVEFTEQDSMVLKRKTEENRILQFVKNTSGSRTLVVFKDLPIPQTGVLCSIMIEQTASSFYNVSVKHLQLVSLLLQNKAPWEE